MKKHEELVVITKTYDLILWSCNHTGRFPRQHRFVLGERDGLCTYWHENGMKSQEDTWKYGVVVSIRKWDKEGNEL